MTLTSSKFRVTKPEYIYPHPWNIPSYFFVCTCREGVDLSEIHISNLINNDISHRLSFGQLCMGKNAILADRRRRSNKDLFGRRAGQRVKKDI